MDLDYFVSTFDRAKELGVIKLDGTEAETARDQILKFTEKRVNDYTLRLLFRDGYDKAICVFDDLEGCQRCWNIEGIQGIEHMIDQGFYEESPYFLATEAPYILAFLNMAYPRLLEFFAGTVSQV